MVRLIDMRLTSSVQWVALWKWQNPLHVRPIWCRWESVCLSNKEFLLYGEASKSTALSHPPGITEAKYFENFSSSRSEVDTDWMWSLSCGICRSVLKYKAGKLLPLAEKSQLWIKMADFLLDKWWYNCDQTVFFNQLPVPTISGDNKSWMDRTLKDQEILEAINHVKGGKTAGPDRLPTAIYKLFKIIIIILQVHWKICMKNLFRRAPPFEKCTYYLDIKTRQTSF